MECGANGNQGPIQISRSFPISGFQQPKLSANQKARHSQAEMLLRCVQVLDN